ncbi:CPBP family intramembrane glutamic endopeptidase [Butyrivibrio sp. JL13D10]|uniref:CPBP family intramembrane glutamic endopeptidase n=1 Tax=Butyrivibrio sp. JL13D10 TaxID=3236815 RepID=UPI0038B60EC7
MEQHRPIDPFHITDKHKIKDEVSDPVEYARKMEQKFHDASALLAILMSGICAWLMFYALWKTLGRPFSIAFMVQAEDALGIFLFIEAYRHTSFSWSDLGLWTDEPAKVVKQALIICALGFAGLCLVKYVGQLYDPSLFRTEHGFFDIHRFNLYQVLYLFTAFIQEFIARSALQSNLKRIAIRNKSAYSIIQASIIFAMFHIQYGFFFMIGAATLGGLLGIMFDRQKTLLGVWIVHWFLGVAAYLLGIIAQ